MRLLITRPREDAIPLAQALSERGHIPVLEPLFDIRMTASTLPDLTAVSALIFTSANGVRAFLSVSSRRDLPAYAVGDRTAKALSNAGFLKVFSATGDSVALAALIRREHRPETGALLHVAGTEVAGDLAGTLQAQGYTVDRVQLYEACAASRLSVETRDFILQRQLDGVLLFSPRTALLFQRLIDEAGLGSSLKTLSAWCLSPAVAAQLTPSSYAKICVTPEPTQAAMLHMIETSF